MGTDFKADLKKIEEHYDKIPEIENEQGLNAIANCPPHEGDFLVSRLWDRHLPKWRFLPEKSLPRKDATSDNLVNHIKKFIKFNTLRSGQVDFDLSNPDAMVVKRRIQKKKGKWWQVPKHIEDDNDW